MNLKTKKLKELRIDEGTVLRNMFSTARFFYNEPNNTFLFTYPYSANVYKVDINGIQGYFNLESDIFHEKEVIVKLDNLSTLTQEMSDYMYKEGKSYIMSVYEYGDNIFLTTFWNYAYTWAIRNKRSASVVRIPSLGSSVEPVSFNNDVFVPKILNSYKDHFLTSIDGDLRKDACESFGFQSDHFDESKSYIVKIYPKAFISSK